MSIDIYYEFRNSLKMKIILNFSMLSQNNLLNINTKYTVYKYCQIRL